MKLYKIDWNENKHWSREDSLLLVEEAHQKKTGWQVETKICMERNNNQNQIVCTSLICKSFEDYKRLCTSVDVITANKKAAAAAGKPTKTIQSYTLLQVMFCLLKPIRYFTVKSKHEHGDWLSWGHSILNALLFPELSTAAQLSSVNDT